MESPYRVIETNVTEIGRFKVHMDYLERDKKSNPFSYTEVPEGVHILVIVDGKICLLHQYRYAIDQWTYEFCGGSIKKGQKPEEAAMQEVLEETGYEPIQLEYLGHIYTSYGYTNEKVHLFIAFCTASERRDIALEPLEVLDTRLCTEAEIGRLIDEGTISLAICIACWYRYLRKKRN